MPLVHIAVFIEQPTPFLEEHLERLATLNYPHTRLRLFIHNNVRVHRQDISTSLCCYVYTLVTVCVFRSCIMRSMWKDSGHVIVLCFPERGLWDQRKTSGRIRPGLWQCKHTRTQDHTVYCIVYEWVCDSWLCVFQWVVPEGHVLWLFLQYRLWRGSDQSWCFTASHSREQVSEHWCALFDTCLCKKLQKHHLFTLMCFFFCETQKIINSFSVVPIIIDK